MGLRYGKMAGLEVIGGGLRVWGLELGVGVWS